MIVIDERDGSFKLYPVLVAESVENTEPELDESGNEEIVVPELVEVSV